MEVGLEKLLWRSFAFAWGCWFSASPWPLRAECSWPARVEGWRPVYTEGSCTDPWRPSGSGYKPSSTSVHMVGWWGPSGFPGILSRQSSPLPAKLWPCAAEVYPGSQRIRWIKLERQSRLKGSNACSDESHDPKILQLCWLGVELWKQVWWGNCHRILTVFPLTDRILLSNLTIQQKIK